MNAEGLVSAAIQLALALGGSAVLVQLLTLRQNRRKIAGDASTAEANAASTLSGAALQLVESARQSARDARTEADEARATAHRLHAEMDQMHLIIDALEQRERDLVAAIYVLGGTPPDRRNMPFGHTTGT
jgi:hypothetical protein